MPELPEVEVSRRGLVPYLVGQQIDEVIVRNPRLRLPVPACLAEQLTGRTVRELRRRGKYILIAIEPTATQPEGWVIVHLGMSGNLRVVPANDPWRKHDHVAFIVGTQSIRYHDPRRFGLIVWQTGTNPEIHPLLASQGQEPLAPEFDGDWLYQHCQLRKTPIKPLLMDAHWLVGVGNIYAAESLFRAGISPLRAACRIGHERCKTLAEAVRATLEESILAGGSSIRDYLHSDGGAGSFQIRCQVYGRAGQPCLRCSGTIKQVRQAGRSTFYCPSCQR